MSASNYVYVKTHSKYQRRNWYPP